MNLNKIRGWTCAFSLVGLVGSAYAETKPLQLADYLEWERAGDGEEEDN